MKKSIIILSVLIGVIVIAPIIIYIVNFHESSLSQNTETWSHFGNYLNGALTPIVAIVGILVSITVSMFSQKNIEKQEMLQRPLAYIRPLDFENNLEIIFQNKGIGPLIVTKYRIRNPISKIEDNSIFNCLDGLNGDYNFYTGNLDGLVISPNDEKQLFQLNSEMEDFKKLKPKVRNRFKDLEIYVEYTDIYNKKMPPYLRKLNWYGRNITEIKNK